MKMKEVALLFIVILLASCKESNADKITQLVKEWENREIVYPRQMSFVTLGQDTAYNYKAATEKYSIVSYVDSLGCLSCKLELRKWATFITELDSATVRPVPIRFILHPKDKEELFILLKKEKFNYPVCIDENDLFNQLNHFPNDMAFRTFLLDENNRVVAIGNPVVNPKIKELYMNIINGKQPISSENKIQTTVSINKIHTDLGEFNWQQEQTTDVTFTNTGKDLLVIDEVSTSCGCTTVEYSKKPIPPGESLTLKVEYKAEHPENFNKTITVFCNTEDSPYHLKISGNAK